MGPTSNVPVSLAVSEKSSPSEPTFLASGDDCGGACGGACGGVSDGCTVDMIVVVVRLSVNEWNQ